MRTDPRVTRTASRAAVSIGMALLVVVPITAIANDDGGGPLSRDLAVGRYQPGGDGTPLSETVYVMRNRRTDGEG